MITSLDTIYTIPLDAFLLYLSRQVLELATLYTLSIIRPSILHFPYDIDSSFYSYYIITNKSSILGFYFIFCTFSKFLLLEPNLLLFFVRLFTLALILLNCINKSTSSKLANILNGRGDAQRK